ncbi:MAG: hypothetical protein WAZ12_01620 [Candidatus Absconditicoccaceae bacterium]
MRNFGDNDNLIGIDNIFSFENNESKDKRDFEEIQEKKYEDELYSNLE